MTDGSKKGPRGDEVLKQISPPPWMTEMKRYYARHGMFRPEDLARLLATGGGSSEPQLEKKRESAVAVLQHLATKPTRT